MSVRYTCFFLFLFLLIPGMPANSADLDDVDKRLYRVQLSIAEKGNSRAQYYLGEMHEQGLGTKQDIDEAFKWYAKAAEQGDPLAKRKLAHRQEIIAEIKKEQEAEKLKSLKSTEAVTVAVPAKPDRTPPKNPKRSPPVVAETQAVTQAVAQVDQAQQEQDRIKAAEREKRRAAVRTMILDRIRNPIGEAFE